MIKLLGNPAVQGLIALLSLIVAVVALLPRDDGDSSVPPSATAVPSLTATATPTATETPLLEPTNTPPSDTPPPVATQPPTTSGTFPCAATVNPNAVSTILNVVKQFPNRTSTTTGSLNRGEALTVIAQSAGTDVYYQVQRSGQTLGWVAAEYLVLSASCPR